MARTAYVEAIPIALIFRQILFVSCGINKALENMDMEQDSQYMLHLTTETVFPSNVFIFNDFIISVYFQFAQWKGEIIRGCL